MGTCDVFRILLLELETTGTIVNYMNTKPGPKIRMYYCDDLTPKQIEITRLNACIMLQLLRSNHTAKCAEHAVPRNPGTVM